MCVGKECRLVECRVERAVGLRGFPEPCRGALYRLGWICRLPHRVDGRCVGVLGSVSAAVLACVLQREGIGLLALNDVVAVLVELKLARRLGVVALTSVLQCDPDSRGVWSCSMACPYCHILVGHCRWSRVVGYSRLWSHHSRDKYE